VDRGASFVREKIAPPARQQPGIVAAYWLADRGSGRGLAATIWESEGTMSAADAVAREAARTAKEEGSVETAALGL
jgi:hypothetical protein